MSSLTPFGIRSISCIMLSRTCLSLVIDKDTGVGGGCLGYGGKFGVDFILCKPWACKESVDLVFRSIPSIGESGLMSDENFGWSQVMSFFVLVDHITI